jgi:hypothetical protein
MALFDGRIRAPNARVATRRSTHSTFFAVVARHPRISSDIAIARVARVVDSNRVHCAKNLHVRTIGRADARKP